ncbi:MAG: hypothetical protein CMN30_09635 [Sandaracinus sp.]|nr:hypothetical protein [Sandaracinus sp.]|tara:strand:- start:1014 stop:2372 length:1359 start_codon:yes stop_codon:yes gene_type:complete
MGRFSFGLSVVVALAGCLPDTHFETGDPDGGAPADAAPPSDTSTADAAPGDLGPADLGGDCVRAEDCPAAPGPFCRAGDAITTTATCASGRCGYAEATETCASGCTAGTCDVACTPETWSIVDVPGVEAHFNADAEHVVDAAGGDHLVYILEGSVHYLHRPLGGGWIDEAVAEPEGGFIFDDPALAIDAAGEAHIVYETYDGNVVYLGPDGSGRSAHVFGNGSSPAVAVLASGQVHVLYGSVGGMHHAIQDPGTGDWTDTRVLRTTDALTTGLSAEGVQVHVLPDQRLAIVFEDYREDGIGVGFWDGAAWTYDAAYDRRVRPGSYRSALDADGDIHVCFAPDDSASTALFHVEAAGAAGWQTATVAERNIRGGPCALAVSPSGDIHIAYRVDVGRTVDWATYAPGDIGFHGETLEANNGFPFGAHADAAGRVRLLYQSADDTFRVAERRDCD